MTLIAPDAKVKLKGDGSTFFGALVSEELTLEELERLINGYTREEIPDAQMAAFLMAGACNGFSDSEATALTGAMLRCGQRVERDSQEDDRR